MTVIERHRDVAACTPKIFKYPEVDIIDNVGHILYRDFGVIHKGEWKTNGNFNSIREVFGICLAAPLIRREVISQIGLLEEFYDYTSGDEWSIRMRSKGWKILFVPNAIAYHKRQRSQNKDKRFLYYLERNRIYSLVQYMPLQIIVKSPYYTLKRFIYSRHLKNNKQIESLNVFVSFSVTV